MTMSRAIKEAFGESGGTLSKEAIKQSVESRYPGKWRPTTLSAHLYACAINNPKAYVHHPHAERFLYKHTDGTFELYEEKGARTESMGAQRGRGRVGGGRAGHRGID